MSGISRPFIHYPILFLGLLEETSAATGTYVLIVDRYATKPDGLGHSSNLGCQNVAHAAGVVAIDKAQYLTCRRPREGSHRARQVYRADHPRSTHCGTFRWKEACLDAAVRHRCRDTGIDGV